MKKCVIILPYFGHFNNYFDIFLKSCEYNPQFDWLIFTDETKQYCYPDNVHVYPFTLHEVKKLAQSKIDQDVKLDFPYKLCDYKPTYGLLFEEYIQNYEYWGHCDCDLIFGNLKDMLTPLLDADYDKIFAAGHLTLYKNTAENNRRFFKEFKGENIYKEALTKDKIYIFDEDMGEKNIHSIFLEDNTKMYMEDLSMNVAINSARLVRDQYLPEKRCFVKMQYKPTRYYWNDGKLFGVYVENNKLVFNEYLYMHLQMRKMRVKKNVISANCIQILPDRFCAAKGLPHTLTELRKCTIGLPNLYWIDEYIKKLKRKWTQIKLMIER